MTNDGRQPMSSDAVEVMARVRRDIRRVLDAAVDDMVAARMAQGEPSPTGTSSAEGVSWAPSAAPSMAPAADAPASTGGSDGGGDEAAAVHQTTPQVGDVYESPRQGLRATLIRRIPGNTQTWVVSVPGGPERSLLDLDAGDWRLVERGGRLWPSEAPDVAPATDEQIAEWVRNALPSGSAHAAIDALIARVRQEQAAREELHARLVTRRRERDEALARAERQRELDLEAHDRTVDCFNRAERRAEKAEAEVARMRPVVDAALKHRLGQGHWSDFASAVDDYRAAEKDAQS